MQKALEEVALYNYKQRETVPRHHGKAQLISWAGQHIGTAGTSSIHPFSNYTLMPICFSSTFDMQFLLYLPYSARARLARVWINWNHLQFYKRNPFKNESDQKKSCQKIETAFHFTREIPLKFFGKKFFHYFLQGNPFTIFQKKK